MTLTFEVITVLKLCSPYLDWLLCWRSQVRGVRSNIEKLDAKDSDSKIAGYILVISFISDSTFLQGCSQKHSSKLLVVDLEILILDVDNAFSIVANKIPYAV